MKKIEEKMVAAVKGSRNFKCSNTEVKVEDGVITVLLFGNEIMRKTPTRISYCSCGYPTVTTASRLRALGANVTLKRNERKLIFN